MAPTAKRSARIVTVAVIVMAVVFLYPLFDSDSAEVKSIDVLSVDIEAEVGTDGSVTVSETREIEFHGDFTVVYWYLDADDFDGIEVTGVTVEDGDGNTRDLASVPFQTEWRTSGGPSDESYSVDSETDSAGNAISADPYVFADFSDGSAWDVTIHYTILGGVQVYNDVAELYWQMVGSDFSVSLDSFTATVSLPMPTGDQVIAGDNVRAWGHGPLTGSVDIGSDGVITLTAPRVQAGQYVEVRTTFPTDWMTDFSGIVQDADVLPTILEQEQEWADQANAERTEARLVALGFIGIPALFLAVAFVIWFKFGRDPKPQWQGDYFRDIPTNIHPAVVSALWKNNQVKPEAFTATLMSLTDRGVISLEKTFSRNWRGKEIEDYKLVLNADKRAEATDPIDARALRIVFDIIGGGAREVPISSFKDAGKKSRGRISDAMHGWNKEIRLRLSKEGLIDDRANKLRIVGTVLASLSFIIAFFALSQNEYIIGAIGLVLASATVLFAHLTSRRTQEGADVRAKCAGLRRWFKDFSNLKEAIPTDIKIWNSLLVYAVILDVSKEVAEQLKTTVPEICENPHLQPMVVWVWAPPHGSSPGDMLSRDFNTLANTLASGTSDGGGGGGGFSSGGGGGGGGGGFGAR